MLPNFQRLMRICKILHSEGHSLGILGICESSTVLLIIPRRYFCGGSFCFMSRCLIFCAVGALCMFSYF